VAVELQERFGRAQHEPVRAELQRAPAPSRREWHLRGRGDRGRTAVAAPVGAPVWSVHITETDASDSIALSCCASTPRRAILAADTAAVSDTSRINPSGTMFTTAAVSVSVAWARLTPRIASDTPSAIPSGAITATSTI